MDHISGALQRTLSATFQQRVVCNCKQHVENKNALKPYAFIVYERDDIPNSTGSVLFYADSPSEIIRRAHIPSATVYRMLENDRLGRPQSDVRLPFIIKKVYLS